MRMVVVLPEPFGPRKPTISPSETFRSTLSTTVRVAEALRQAVHVDDRLAGGVHGAAPGEGATSTGWPSGRPAAAPDSNASARKTSLSRVSRL